MEDKKPIKISLKIAILLIVILLILVAVIAFFVLNYNKKNDVSNLEDSKDYKSVSIDGETYYRRLNKNTWDGEYYYKKFDTENRIDNIMEVVSYKEYLDIINSVESEISSKIKPYYSNKNSNYIVISYANGYSWCELELIDCIEKNNKIIVYGDEEVNGVMAGGSGYFIVIPTDMPVGTKIEYRECYSSSEIKNIKKYGNPQGFDEMMVDKPIIYLYPEEEIEVSVKLLKTEKLTCSYPKYNGIWKVLAKTNGDLKDLVTGRQLYSLYYESKSEIEFKVENEGFIVEGKDTIEFLEEKLAILGLTEKEAEEFIIYWLPKLEANKYNYIRFASLDEINENMPLEINPNPDTIIRVLMTFKGLENPINVEEQKLETPERTGFVAVEWGGSEIK